jgi:DNA-binding protein YbaB
MFDKAKMISQAYKLKKAIESETIEIEESGIKVIVSGDQKLKYLSINGIENRILIDTINKGMKKSQEMAAKRMKDMGGAEYKAVFKLERITLAPQAIDIIK